MTYFRIHHAVWGAGAAMSVWLSGCVGPVEVPAPAVVVARAAVAPPVSAAPADWHDMPATPGVWRWQREGGMSAARFGEAGQPVRFSLVCDPATATISLARGGGGGATTMAILTTSLAAKLAARAGADGATVAMLPARDPLLDAMAYSRGRFAVQVAGVAWLYLPSWPEVGRVVEDCREPGG